MKRTIARRTILPMAGIVLVVAFLASWGYSRVRERERIMDARHDIDTFGGDLVDLIALTHDQLNARLGSEMRMLQAEARRLGAGTRGPMRRAGARSVPDLRFGGVSQAKLMARVEPVSEAVDEAISVFSLWGGQFIRLSGRGYLPDDGQAPGLALDPGGPAHLALSRGRSYWGLADASGGPQFTCFEPIRTAAGSLIGAFGIQYPLARLTAIRTSVRRIESEEGVLLVVADRQGSPVFSGHPMTPADIRALTETGRGGPAPWMVQRRSFEPWGVTVLAAYPMAGIRHEGWVLRLGALAVALALVGLLTLSYFVVLRRNLLRPLGDLLGILGLVSAEKRYESRFSERLDGEMGQLARALNGMFEQVQSRDRQLVDHQEHLEELVAQRLDQLLQAKELLSATLDALPASIAILDGDGAVLVANLQWDLLTGSVNPLIADARVGTDYLALCRAVDPGAGSLRAIAGQIAEVIAGTRGSLSLDYDLDLAGQRQWFTVLATRFVTQGAPRTVLMHLNVTDQRLVEAQLRQAQKLESIGQLAAGIAHEINTPTQYIGDNALFLRGAFQELLTLLLPLRALAEAARAGTCPPGLAETAGKALDQADLDYLQAEIPRAFDQSMEGVRRVATIVGAMKDFSHPGTGVKTPTDLNRAIESTALVCRSEWKYTADLELDLAPDLPPVPCLPDEFNQVILNLVINAVHAVAETARDGKGLIRISTRLDGDWARIAVADTGAGIPEAIRSRIFDPFFTTKVVGKGTGQGLAIAHAVIVEQHGGRISVQSEVGKGTTFTLSLPLTARPALAPAALEAP